MYNSAALLIFMRCTTPVETSESMNSPKLFHPQSQGSTPHGLILTQISPIDVKKHLTSIYISDKIIKSLYKVP